jgi:hypothetical protein
MVATEMKTISLNIFTNCTRSAPDTKIIERTYQSFCDRFGEIEPTIYMDHNPNNDKALEYCFNLYKITKNVMMTNSLSVGYQRSVNASDADYLFQCEHDWLFLPTIKHSLQEIIDIMESEGIYHFRFNKRQNLPAVWDKYMRESTTKSGFKYCRSNNLSNNPHIINRKYYLENMIQHTRILPGSKGVEECLNAVGKFESCLYGGLGYPATVEHLDGRKR